MIQPAQCWPIAALLWGLSFAAALADGAPPVPVRTGTHPGHGRVVFDLPTQTDYSLTQEGDHVTLRFTGDMTIGSATNVPHNVIGITGGAGQADLVVAPGSVVQGWLSGNHVVIDVWDKNAAPNTQAASAPATPRTQPRPVIEVWDRNAAPNIQGASTPAAPRTQPRVVAPRPAQLAPPAKAADAGPPPSAKAPAAPASPAPPTRATAAPPAPAPVAPLGTPAVTPLGTPAVTPPGTPSKVASVPAIAAPKPPPTIVQPPAPTPPPTTPQFLLPAPPAVSEAPSAPPPPGQPQIVPPPAPVVPVEAVADEIPQPAPMPNPVLAVSFDSPAGAAAFRRGNMAMVVFDQQRTVDTAPSRDDPVFGTATVQKLPTATVIRFPLDADTMLSMSRTANVWRITAIHIAPTLRPIVAAATDNRLVLKAATPGTVVNIADPGTGTTLLVGTQRQEGQGTPLRRRSVQFSLLPTWQGVAVEAIADTLTLRPGPEGFVLTGGPAGLDMSPLPDAADLLANAASLTRQFDFPSQPTASLMQQLRFQVSQDASTPPLGRGPRRQAVARTMISLGLGAEAQAVLQMAAADDPNEAASPDNAALASIAAVLAHRPDEATGLNNPVYSGADDVLFWRALRQAEEEQGSAAAAAIFSATLPLVIGYPSEIRHRVLPLVAETLVAGGETAMATALFDARKDDAALDMARGMLRETQGDNAAALTIYDRLAQSRDRSLHARGAVHAVELRLASGGIDARRAADQLDRLLYAWRGDRHERALRERLAELRARGGAWRSALALLRETEALFPDDKAAIHAELTDMFAALLRGNNAASLAPLELAALAEENADLLPEGTEGDALQAQLADRLLALDLPKRAEPVLEKLMKAAPSDVGRASFGARLASLRLREVDVAGAFAALSASAGADLPPELVERRTMLLAAAHARRGDTDRALAILASLGTAAADEARATIHERANDWPAAQQALADFAAKTVPSEGRLDDAQRRTVLRLVTAAARAGDDAALTAIRQREGPRMESGPLADMFRLLTADPVRGVADLKRAGQEAGLARDLPAQLKAMQSAPQQ